MRPIVSDFGTSLWRLLPGNPIVVRVIQIGSKRSQHFWARVGYLLVLFFVMLIVHSVVKSETTDSLVASAKSATRVFEGISLLQLGMMCFLAPIFTAGAISQEKDAETFNVLLSTPLTNAQIALGSLMSRLFFVLTLLLSGLPIFCITMLYGGVTGPQIFLSFGIAACTAILTGSTAILISVMKVGTRGTIFSFYAGIAVFLLAGFGLGLVNETHVAESIPVGEQSGMSWLAPFHPFLALSVALSKPPAPDFADVAYYGWPWNRMLASPPTAYMIITLIVSALQVGLATFFVRRGIKQGEVSLLRKLLRRGRTEDGEGGGEKTRRARRVWSNPVAWREAVTKGSASSSSLARYGYIALGAAAGISLLIAYNSGTFGPPGTPNTAHEARLWLTWIVIIEFITVLMMAINTAATAITRERESATMELLLTTPLTSRYIIWGKLRGLVSFTIPLMAVPVGTVLLMAINDGISNGTDDIVHIASAIALPPLLLTYSALVCMIGLHMSLKCRSSVQAVLTSVGILLVVGFGLGLCAFGASQTAEAAAGIMAPFTFVTAIYFVLMPQEIGHTHITETMSFIVVGMVFAIAIYGGIVAAIYKTMVRDFDMIIRKQSK